MLRHAKVPGNITRLITSIFFAPGLKWNRNFVPRIDLTRSVVRCLMRAGTKVANIIVFWGPSDFFFSVLRLRKIVNQSMNDIKNMLSNSCSLLFNYWLPWLFQPTIFLFIYVFFFCCTFSFLLPLDVLRSSPENNLCWLEFWDRRIILLTS